MAKFLHLRPAVEYEDVEGENKGLVTVEVAPHGGTTYAYETYPEDKKIRYAWSHCSARDPFNYQLGRVKAEGRLRAKDTNPTCAPFKGELDYNPETEKATNVISLFFQLCTGEKVTFLKHGKRVIPVYGIE